MTAERAIFVSVLAVGAASSAVVVGVAGARAGTSVLFGTGIALLNLWALRKIVRIIVRAAEPQGERSGALGIFLGPKLVALLLLVWILLGRHIVSAGPFALGYAALPIGVAIGALVCEKPAH